MSTDGDSWWDSAQRKIKDAREDSRGTGGEAAQGPPAQARGVTLTGLPTANGSGNGIWRTQAGTVLDNEGRKIPIYSLRNDQGVHQEYGLGETATREQYEALAHQTGGTMGFFPNATGFFNTGDPLGTALGIESYLFGNPRRQSMLDNPNVDVGNILVQQTHPLDGMNARQVQQTLMGWDLNDPDALATLQKELVDAGYMDEPALWGRLAEETQVGMERLLMDSYDWTQAGFNLSLRGHLSQNAGRGEAQRRGRGGGGGGGGPTFAFQQMSDDELALLVDNASKEAIHRKIGDEEKATASANIAGQIESQARGRFDASQSGGGFVQEDPQVIAQREIYSQFSNEVGAVDYSAQIDTLRQALGGI
ncbi:MAG: hypothetical protein GY701_07100 [Sulfitobacter sp.]|nr:hypothetical protein [Sulfitobacter sp.]